MCNFFSFISDGCGNLFYFNAALRDKIIRGKLTDCNQNVIDSTDSHTSICAFFSLNENVHNKWEYDVFTRRLKLDSQNTANDRAVVLEKVKAIDFKTVVPQLIIKDVVNPRMVKRGNTVDEREIDLLKKWACVCDSVRHSVWNPVLASVGDCVWNSVGYSVGNSVRDSVRQCGGDFVFGYVRDSLWASVWAYISSFFNLKKYARINHEPGINPFQSCIDLWERGLVPSFDGTTWRLHAGEDMHVAYEMRGA